MTASGPWSRAGRRTPPLAWRSALRWAIGLAILGVALVAFDVGAVAERLRGTHLGLASLAIIGLVAAHLVAVVGWRRLNVAFVGTALAPWPAVRRYYAGQALGTVTPGNVGADAYRVASGPGQGTGLMQRAVPIVVQRLTSVAALVVLGLAGAAQVASPTAAPVVLAGATLATAVGLAAWLHATRTARTDGERAGAGPRLQSALLDGLGLGLIFHALAIGLGLLLVVAVDPGVGRWPDALAALAIARLALAVPLAPHGIGIQEGALALVFAQLGLPVETAVAAALLSRLATVGTGLVGLAILLGGPGPSRALPSSEPTSPVSPLGT